MALTHTPGSVSTTINTYVCNPLKARANPHMHAVTYTDPHMYIACPHNYSGIRECPQPHRCTNRHMAPSPTGARGSPGGR